MEVFRNLSTEDFRELELFLESGYNNRSPIRNDVIRLFEILCAASPAFAAGEIKKEKVYDLLFPGMPLIKGKLEKVASELNKLVRDYLLGRYYQSNDASFVRGLHWAGILRNFSLNERFDQFLNRLEKEHLTGQKYAPSVYFNRFLLEYERHLWMVAFNSAKKDINISATVDSLSVFFEIYRMELLNQLLIQQKFTHFEIPPSVQKNLDFVMHLTPADQNILLTISSQIHTLLRKDHPTLEEFTGLMALLTNHEKDIHPAMISDYYTYLRNFCSFLISIDHDELIPVLHRLHRDNLERGYLYADGKLSATSYLSITKMALIAGETEWATDFVEKHKDLVIGETEQYEFYSINKAQCLFAKKAFDQVLDLLPPVSENAMYYLQARRLEIMCYYELKSDQFINKVEAFKMLTRRASERFLSAAQYEINNAFVNILYQIAISPPGDKNRAKRIAARIEAKKPLAESRWLLAKVKEWG